MGSIFGRWENPEETDLLGAASCIFWTITLVPLIEYVFIILYADDLGEGQGLLRCSHTMLALIFPQPRQLLQGACLEQNKQKERAAPFS